MKHYHVMVSLEGGYMPDSNEIYASKHDAQNALRWWRDTFKEEGNPVSGSIKAGLIIQENLPEDLPSKLRTYAELFACADAACLEEEG